MAEKIVREDIFCNVSGLVEFSIKMSSAGDNDAPVTYEDFEGMPPDFGQMDRDQLLEWLEENVSYDLSQYADLDDQELAQECEDNWESPEILEYWAVSSWLADKLRERGEAVASAYQDIWGRCTSGQAIRLDGVIRGIAKYLVEL
jgi:hypothetical protein